MRPGRRVALTFDDGPQPGATDRFLELLARLEVRATFFLVGEQVRRFPGLARQIEAAGHEVGNHGYRHRSHLLRSPRDILADVRLGTEVLREPTGQEGFLFRPPYGVVSAATLLAAFRQGSPIVLWTAWGRDWRANATADSIAHDALHRVQDGGVILLHDADHYGRRSWHATYQAVPGIVAELRRRGLEPGPIGGSAGLGC